MVHSNSDWGSRDLITNARHVSGWLGRRLAVSSRFRRDQEAAVSLWRLFLSNLKLRYAERQDRVVPILVDDDLIERLRFNG